jgi:hypothetical protein
VVAEPFAETLEPRGKRSLVGWLKLAIVFVVLVARVGHAFDTRKQNERSRQSAALKAARTILAESGQVKEGATSTNHLKSLSDWAFSQGRNSAKIVIGHRSNEHGSASAGTGRGSAALDEMVTSRGGFVRSARRRM